MCVCVCVRALSHVRTPPHIDKWEHALPHSSWRWRHAAHIGSSLLTAVWCSTVEDTVVHWNSPLWMDNQCSVIFPIICGAVTNVLVHTCVFVLLSTCPWARFLEVGWLVKGSWAMGVRLLHIPTNNVRGSSFSTALLIARRVKLFDFCESCQWEVVSLCDFNLDFSYCKCRILS